MVLYHTVSTYHILRSILHKMNYNESEEAVLLVPSFFPKLPYALKTRENNKIFSKIIYYEWEYKRYEDYPADVYKEIDECLAKFLGSDYLEKISEYNVFNAGRFFGSYLAENNIEFNWFEEADGRYANPYPPMYDDKRMHPERYLLANKLGLYTGENECIKNIYISKKANLCIEDKENIIDFDANNELSKLSNSQIEDMLLFWGALGSKIEIEENSALLMSQHFCNIKLITFEEQALLYQLTVDYFLSDKKLYLKMHPSDLFPYEEFIEGIELLEADYPSELLKYVCENRFDIVGAVSSTGVRNLEDISERCLLINEDYIHSYVDNDLYYFASKVIEMFDEMDVMMLGGNEIQMQAMLTFGISRDRTVNVVKEIDTSILNNKIIIISDDVEKTLLEKVSECEKNNCIIILLKLSGNPYELQLIENLYKSVKTVRTFSKESEEAKLLYENMLFVLSDDEEYIRKVDAMGYEKILRNTKLNVRVDKNLDADTQVAILSGMLEATEKSLKYYIEENRMLEKELEKLKKNM